MKTIFITGTSSGLGEAAVHLFHAQGWHVIATMRDTSKGKAFDGLKNVTILPLDISKPDEIQNAARSAIALGKVDVVLNNAAYGAIGPMESVSNDELLKQIDTNLLGAIRVTQSFIPHLRQNKSGIIVNVTSVAGLVTFPFDSLYHAVKWGLHGWSEGLSYELALFGIRVKTVAPGYIRTEFGSNMVITTSEPYQQHLDHYLGVVNGMMNPTTSGSTPEEVAAVIYEAVTDSKDQVHYIAGADCQSMVDRRLEIGAEAAIREMNAIFLG